MKYKTTFSPFLFKPENHLTFSSSSQLQFSIRIYACLPSLPLIDNISETQFLHIDHRPFDSSAFPPSDSTRYSSPASISDRVDDVSVKTSFSPSARPDQMTQSTRFGARERCISNCLTVHFLCRKCIICTRISIFMSVQLYCNQIHFCTLNCSVYT